MAAQNPIQALESVAHCFLEGLDMGALGLATHGIKIKVNCSPLQYILIYKGEAGLK